ncbi:MAG: Gfo/Idh/MocA family oxidoreductase [Acidobacteria bacterium]|nr:Gfo/Idh/MocA family oxidoreductase [Acidobacteriota bacterium]
MDIRRREFFSTGTSAVLATAASPAATVRPVRFGVVGAGNRGTALIRTLLHIPNIEVRALCDIEEKNLVRAQNLLEKAAGRRPEGYQRGPDDYRRMMTREDLDAVLIATPWHWHTPMAVEAMKCGKYAAVEVPAAITLEQCWDLVNTCQQTKVPCMMLENWSFRRDNLAVLRMIREGLLGEIVHCHCAHSHNCIDHWFFDADGNDRWGAEYLVKRNADQYPTHSLGPVISWMDIHCGDAFAWVTSTATESRAINAYFARKFGPEHPNARRKFAQGDIVTSVVRTHRGKTIVINYDMQLPRPYDNRWMVQGTLGLYDEDKAAVYLTGRSLKYQQWESFDPYQRRYEHGWWKAMREAGSAAEHGGTDYLELSLFVEAVRGKTQTPIDVYDSAIMSAMIPLSEESIRRSSAPIACPDFTRGQWREKKPSFALDG